MRFTVFRSEVILAILSLAFVSAASRCQVLGEFANVDSALAHAESVRVLRPEGTIHSLPPQISTLHNLRVVNFEACDISALPDEFFTLNELTEIYICGDTNLVKGGFLSRFRTLPNLRKLALDSLNLYRFIDSVPAIADLRSLSLHGNRLTQLPTSIRGNPALQHLNLSSNRLSSLPPWLNELASLTDLVLADNLIQDSILSPALPSSLRYLDLSGNRNIDLGKVLGRSRSGSLTSLTALDCDISTFPCEITELPELRTLNLSYNKLRSLPPCIERLQALTSLSVSNNDISELPQQLGSLKKLKNLDLHANSITRIPNVVTALHTLRSMYVMDNPLPSDEAMSLRKMIPWAFIQLPWAAYPDSVRAAILYRPYISMVQLLANPEKHHGQQVIVTGFLHVKFEDSGLYLTKEDGDHLDGTNAFWVSYAENVRLIPIDRDSADPVTLPSFDCRRVTLTGTFSKDEHGHMGAFAGTLRNVVQVVEDRRWYDGKRDLWESDEKGQLRPKRE